MKPRSYPRFVLIAAFALSAFQVHSPVFAQKAAVASAKNPMVTIEEEKKSALWDRVDLYGDLRLRYELDYDSVRADGVTARDDRNRFRTRARLGLKIQPTDWFMFDIRGRYGDSDSQQSPHVTLWQDGGSEGEQSDGVFDRLYLGFRGEKFTADIGREGFPFWTPHELYWDADMYVDGGSIGYKTKVHETGLDFVAGFWALPDGPDNFDYSDQSLLSAAQVKLTHDFGENGKLIIADGLMFIDDNSSVFNTTNDDVDYSINAFDLQYQFDAGEIPVTLGGTYLHNFDDGPQGDPVRGDTDGFVLYGKLGKLSEKGDWLLGYYYADIEKYSVARFFAQDDWFRFGSASQTRASDFRGHEIRLAYALAKNLNLVLRGYFVETISNREDGNRVRVDLNLKF